MKQVKVKQILLYQVAFLVIETREINTSHKVLLGQLRLTGVYCFIPKLIELSPICVVSGNNVNFKSA